MKIELWNMLMDSAKADKSKAHLTLNLLSEHPAGIGDHSTQDFYNNAEEALRNLVDAVERIQMLNSMLKDKQDQGDLEAKWKAFGWKAEMSKVLTLKEREVLCSQKGATWDLQFDYTVADRWGIPKLRSELTLDQIQYLDQNKEDE
tara:strand:+ start:207 stop:644 length:438 start_codon:yes stop_codon:yes gene_type:complete